MTSDQPKKLTLGFHGRIIDSLGIQMYQSPVAAVAELIANAWDADASKVSVTLPAGMGEGAEIGVQDDGMGMTFGDCQVATSMWDATGDYPRAKDPRMVDRF